MKKRISIDIGTANTKILDKFTGEAFSSPSVVAIDNKTSKIIAAGIDAKNMLGRAPTEVSVVYPLKCGAISDFDVACAMIRVFLNEAFPKSTFRIGAELIVSPELTDMEKRILKEAAERAGVKVLSVVNAPISEANRIELDTSLPTGQMILDIGAGKSRASVISFGGIVSSATTNAGGDEMDKNIQDYLKSAYGISVGKNTAEQIKYETASAHPSADRASFTFMGRTCDTGLPCEITVSSDEIRHAIAPTLFKILDVLKTALESTPPELAHDLKANGIILCGGGSAICGLSRFIEENIGLFAVGANA